jgi:hypothetical protein
MDLTALVAKSDAHSRLHDLHLHPSTRLLNNHALLEDIFRIDLISAFNRGRSLPEDIFRIHLMNGFNHDHSGRIQEVADVPIQLGGKAWNRVEWGLYWRADTGSELLELLDF